MSILIGIAVGLAAWFLTRYLAAGIFTVDQSERAVKTRFGRAERVGHATTLQDPIAGQPPLQAGSPLDHRSTKPWWRRRR